MTALVVEARSSASRRQLGALAWALLEEVALAATADANGVARTSVSVRWAAERLAVGKSAATRAIRHLIDQGVLVRLPAGRVATGRFAAASYLLLLPEGLTVSGLAVSGGPDTGAGVQERVGQLASRRASRRRGQAVAVARPVPASGQASLFGHETVAGETGVAAMETPDIDETRFGAVVSDGCGSDFGGHELAPVVPAQAGRDAGEEPC